MRFILPRLILLVACFGVEYRAHAMPESLHIMLAKHMKFSKQDLLAVQRGELVARPLETSAKQEVAFFGIIYVNAPPALLIQKFRDIETFKAGESVLKIKKLSDPPSKEDFKQMTLDKDDLRELKKCKPGKCDMKLSAAMIEQFHKSVNVSDRNYEKKATELYHDLLFEYVQSYLSRGNSSLLEYYDQKKRVPLSVEFKAILAGYPYLHERLPEFYQYLYNYPKEKLQNIENYIYWSRETLQFRAVTTITHVSMYRPNPREAIFASKQIYANHYLTGSLALTGLISEHDDQNKPGFYMMYINRTRTDMFGGLFSGLKRSLTKSRSTTALKEGILSIKQRLETEYRKKGM
jgi:hypothetical protein